MKKENEALYLTGNGEFKIAQKPVPPLSSDEVLVRVYACGICSSDIPRAFLKKAYHYPLVLGHEFSGTVVEIGSDVDPCLVGCNVTVYPLLPCFDCEQCRARSYVSCKSYDYYGSRRDGGLSNYLVVKRWNVLPIPDGVSLLDASLTEPVAVGLHGLKRAGLFPLGERAISVLVIGAGLIGLTCVDILRLKSPHIKVSIADRNQYKLDFVHDPSVEQILIDDSHPVYGLVSDNESAFDVVIEATGAPALFEASLLLTKPRGTTLWIGNIAGDLCLPERIVSKILRKELRIIGTWNSDYFGPESSDWTDVLDMMSMGLSPSRYITDLADFRSVATKMKKFHLRKSDFTASNMLKIVGLIDDVERTY